MKYQRHFRNEQSANARPMQALTQRTDSSQPEINVRPSRLEIAKNAYFIYLQQGRPHGREVQHWLEAEAQMIDDRRDDLARDGESENQNVDKTRTGDFGTTLLL